jgi:hypothetical protein
MRPAHRAGGSVALLEEGRELTAFVRAQPETIGLGPGSPFRRRVYPTPSKKGISAANS